MRALIAIAGGAGSGKSSIASALAEILEGQQASFGDAVRAEAKRRGLDADDRTTLQDLGNDLINEGWGSFVGRVMATVANDVDVVVIEGVRHHDAIAGLRSASGGRTVLTVFVRTSLSVRIERLTDRDGKTRAEVEVAIAHSNEHEVESLEEVADLVVDNDAPLDIDALAALVRAVVL